MRTRLTWCVAACAALLVLTQPAAASSAEDEYRAGVAATRNFDYIKARGHFEKAAGQGHRDALRNLGMLLLSSGDLSAASARSIAMLKQAADDGDEVSHMVLARLGFYQGC